MTITIRLNALILVTALILGGVASFIAAQRDYQNRLDRILTTSSARLPGQAELQYLIYTRDKKGLETSLDVFLSDQDVNAALIYSGPGDQLATRNSPGARSLDALPFSTVRGNLLAADTALVSVDKRGEKIGSGLLSSLAYRDTPLYYSLPVITAVNPAERGLTPLDFASAQLNGQPTGSQRVIGYLHLMIDRSVLVTAVTSTAVSVIGFSLLIALVCALATWYFIRHIALSLRQLVRLADDVASGTLEEPAQIGGSREIQEIASVFNGMIGQVSSARLEANVDRRLLSMKVKERSAQLTQRDRELNHAVEEVNQTRDQLHQLSNYDSVTHLPNRNLFTEQLDLLLELNNLQKHKLALLSIDLEDYKRVSNSLGLSAGDQLLCVMAERLQEGVREGDSVGYFSSDVNEIGVARLGGDEFAVVLNQVESRESAALVAERLLSKLKQPVAIEGHELMVTPSAGIAIAPGDGGDSTELLRAASAAKLHTRDSGAQMAFYSQELEAYGEERIRMEADLRKAIERNELELHYQPQVDTHSGAVVGAEALLRWNHAELGQVTPGQFIGMAQEIGLMDALNDWVLEKACQELRQFNATAVKLPRITINVSAGDFSSDFAQRVGQAIIDTGIAPEQLELGLSEAIMSSQQQDTIEALRLLKEIGVYLSVDDFGTGYSPISYLCHYPLDELKINRHFLLESSHNENGAKLIAAIIAMGRSLGLNVLASGIETEDEFRLVTENGVHILQGYLFSEPVPADQLKPMLGAWYFIEKVQKLADAAPASALERLSQFE